MVQRTFTYILTNIILQNNENECGNFNHRDDGENEANNDNDDDNNNNNDYNEIIINWNTLTITVALQNNNHNEGREGTSVIIKNSATNYSLFAMHGTYRLSVDCFI